MKYKPRYAKGQVLVHFSNGSGDVFAQAVGNSLGYKYLGRNTSGFCAYATSYGREKKAIKDFKNHSCVEWVGLRDLKLESGMSKLENICMMSQEIRDDWPMDGWKLRRKVKGLITELEKLCPII